MRERPAHTSRIGGVWGRDHPSTAVMGRLCFSLDKPVKYCELASSKKEFLHQQTQIEQSIV